MIPLDDGGSRRARARLAAPDPDLQDLVEHLCVLEDEGPPACGSATLRIVPDTAPHLLLHAAATDGAARLRVVGLRSRHVDIDVTGRRATVAVRLRPWALAALGVDAAEVLDRGVDADDVGLPGMDVWNERLAAAADHEERCRLLQGLVRSARRRRSAGPGRVRDAARALLAAPARAPVSDVAARTGVPARTLRERFRRELGLGPKRFDRIARLLRSLEGAVAACAPDWRQLAAEAGYCDQSHLANEWRRLLGESPERFLSRRGRSRGPASA